MVFKKGAVRGNEHSKYSRLLLKIDIILTKLFFYSRQ